MEAQGGRGLQGAASLLCSVYSLSYEMQPVPAILQGWEANRGSMLQTGG